MSFVQNVPCFSILLAMFAAIITSAVRGKTARKICIGLTIIEGGMSAWLLSFLWKTGESYVYVMGHFPAPWGNELRAGMLEAGMAFFLCVIMVLSLWGGVHEIREDLEADKAQFYYIMADLLLASLLALVYTNDMFTAYVFVEINTIAACGLIMMKQSDLTLAAAVRYMIMSLMGSGLLLIGICLLYDMTGHLLMSNIKEQIISLATTETYHIPLLLTIGLISIGLAIKSALWPFHTWLPGAYGYSTVSSSAMLSSMVSKGYIFLLLKIIYRVIGADTFAGSHVINILFIFGIVGMVIGSLDAIRENNLKRMIAYSSVAQIGYIFMGIGIGTDAGVGAGMYHIFAHAASKALVFIAASGLIRASGGKSRIQDLAGAGFRNKLAGAGFVAGALSMIGIPGFAGFASKLMFAQASLVKAELAIPVFMALAVSTVLNAIYFMRVALLIYTPDDVPLVDAVAGAFRLRENQKHSVRNVQPEGVLSPEGITGMAGTNAVAGSTARADSLAYAAAILLFIALNLFLGICTQPVLQLIQRGLVIFG